MEFFDSLAQVPDRDFVRYMNDNRRHWIRKHSQIQSIISRFCGHHCVMYCLLRAKGFDLNRIIAMYTPDFGANECGCYISRIRVS